MKIKTIKSFHLEGKAIKAGEVINVQSGFTARELIRYGKAFAVADSTVIAKPVSYSEASDRIQDQAEKAGVNLHAAPEAEAPRKAGRPRKVKPETGTE
jgi:hypothetical protein